MKALVINGPNLNMLGIREPGIYGSDNYDRLVQICQEAGAAQGFDEVEVFQSNHEGSIVDKIQEAYGKVDGLLRHHHRRGPDGLRPRVGAAERASRKVKCQPQQTAAACSRSAPATHKMKKAQTTSGLGLINDGAPWRIRTVDLGIRSPLLYPTELMEQITTRPSKHKPVRRK